MKRKMWILFVALAIGIICWRSCFPIFATEKVDFSFDKQDIESVYIVGVSESVAKQSKVFNEQEEIKQIWDFLDTWESSRKKINIKAAEATGTYVYSIEFYLQNNRVETMTLSIFNIKGDRIFYLLNYNADKTLVISTKNIQDIIKK